MEKKTGGLWDYINRRGGVLTSEPPIYTDIRRRQAPTEVPWGDVAARHKYFTGADPYESQVVDATIEEIHEDFMGAGEKVFQELKSLIDGTGFTDTKRAERLRDLGFVNMPEVKSFMEREARLKVSKDEYDTICRYRVDYPLNNFISKGDVVKLCEKYGLVYAPVRMYKGDIPDANLAEIEAFELKKEDVSVMMNVPMDGGMITMSRNEYETNFYSGGELVDDAPFEIVATKDMIEIEPGYRLNGSRLEKSPNPDPIVLCTVKYGYLIVSLWGKEAEYVDGGKN